MKHKKREEQGEPWFSRFFNTLMRFAAQVSEGRKLCAAPWPFPES